MRLGYLIMLALACPAIAAADPALEPISGSYFEFMPGAVSWDEAMQLASERSYEGMTGHLATPVTRFASDFLADLAEPDTIAWLGGSNRGERGSWHWESGPIAGAQFAELSSREEMRDISVTDWIDPQQAGEEADDGRYLLFERPSTDLDAGWWSAPSSVAVDGYWVEYSSSSVPIYSATTGGYIEFVPAPGIAWSDAKANAEGMSFDGLAGQLATVATYSETTFMRQFFPNAGQAWIAAVDEAGDGTWRWSGQGNEQDVFWRDGQALAYQNWLEPPTGATDAAQFAAWDSTENGAWNALDASGEVEGYFVEYLPRPQSVQVTAGPRYDPANGHVYEVVRLPDDGWDRADFLASNRFLDGVRGHLATITSAEEQAFLDNVLGIANLTGWIAASDADVEGEWRWVAGPESGQLFWEGGPEGQAVGFAHWGGGEPNDLWIEDHAGNSWFGPFWNDFPIWWNVRDAIVEYSLLPGDADLNGVVDLRDFAILKANFGSTGGLGDGNFNFDRGDLVDLEDFAILKANFGATAAVPEPATLYLLLAIVPACAALSRRRSS